MTERYRLLGCDCGGPHIGCRHRADFAKLIEGLESAERQVAEQAAMVEKLRAALEPYAVTQQELSYHGEAICCGLCGQAGTRAGRKRGVGDSPVVHDNRCPLSATPAQALERHDAEAIERCARVADSMLGNPSPDAWPNVHDAESWQGACLRIAQAIRRGPQ